MGYTLLLVAPMTPDSLNVWTQITEAFPPDLPSQPVTTCDCDECRDARANLGRLRWNEGLPPAIDKHFGSLPLLTDDAFRALLPAYLFQPLRNLSGENKFLEWTLYALCAAHDGNDETTARDTDTRLRTRVAAFTEAQRAAVRTFLILASAAPGLKNHRDAIAHALSVLWT